jgi:adenylosuccinate lyase
MHMLGEVGTDFVPGQVGSSAMAHKRNPIVAEQICGLARVGQGYAQMLQPLDLWLERDISNSSVERVAVPGIWHLILHVATQTIEMLRTLDLRDLVIESHLQDKANELWTHKNTLSAISDGMSLEDARAWALEFDVESYDIRTDAEWFVRNYPRREPK